MKVCGTLRDTTGYGLHLWVVEAETNKFSVAFATVYTHVGLIFQVFTFHPSAPICAVFVGIERWLEGRAEVMSLFDGRRISKRSYQQIR